MVQVVLRDSYCRGKNSNCHNLPPIVCVLQMFTLSDLEFLSEFYFHGVLLCVPEIEYPRRRIDAQTFSRSTVTIRATSVSVSSIETFYGPFASKIFYIGWTSDGHWTEWVPIQYYTAFTHIRCRKDGDWI